MADVYLNTGKYKPETTKYKLQYKGNTYHFNNESDYKTLLQELMEIDELKKKRKPAKGLAKPKGQMSVNELQDKNKKFMIK